VGSLSVWKKVGFSSIRQESGVFLNMVWFFTIWHKSGGFFHVARMWGFVDMEKLRVFSTRQNYGFLQCGNKVGVLSIWQESGVSVDMEKSGGF
jgi:hypothetical protein